jgi:serine/threonine protein kinase
MRTIEFNQSVLRDAGLEGVDITMIGASMLIGARLPPLLISQTLDHGSFGKFRLAVGPQEQVYGIKEFRTTDWQRTGPYVGGPKPIKTHPTERDAICQEAKLTALAKGALAFYDLIDVAGKVYGVMPYYDGSDAFTLACTFAQSDRGSKRARANAVALLAYVGHAAAEGLHKLHTSGFAHRDVRLENILWDTTGRVSLADYGKGEAIDENGEMSPVPPGALLTYLAPECFGDDDEALSVKIDIWSLGVGLLNIWVAGDLNVCNPFSQASDLFEHEKTPSELQRDVVTQWGLFHYGYCKAGAVGVDPTLKKLRIYSEFRNLFAQIEAEDATLCAFLIKRMLAPNAQTRADAAEVAAFMQAHLGTSRTKVAQTILNNVGSSKSFMPRNRAILAALQQRAKTVLA